MCIRDSSSRKSIEALNVVGVAGGVASMDDETGLKLHVPAASTHRGSVYKLTRGGKGLSTDISYTVQYYFMMRGAIHHVHVVTPYMIS